MGNGISLESLMDPKVPQSTRDRMILEMQYKTYKSVTELRKEFNCKPEECDKKYASLSKFAWLTMLVLTIVTCLITKALT